MPRDDFFANDSPRRGTQKETLSFDALETQMDRGAAAPPAQDFSGYVPLSFDFDDAPAPTAKRGAPSSPFLLDQPPAPAGADPAPFDFDFGDAVPLETPLNAPPDAALSDGTRPYPSPAAAPRPAPAPQPAPQEDEIHFDDLSPRGEHTKPAPKKAGEIRLDDLPPRPPKPARKSTELDWEEFSRTKPAARSSLPVIEGLEPLPAKNTAGSVLPELEALLQTAEPPKPVQQPPAPAAPQPQTPAPQPTRAVRESGEAPADGAPRAAAPQTAPLPQRQTPAPAAAEAPQAAAGETPARRQRRPGVRPVSKISDSPTLSFSLGNNVNVEAPTLAFMPISDITAAARAEANAKNSVVVPQQPAPSPRVRAARMEKEKNVGAAVFSALMDTPEPSIAGTDSADREGNDMPDPNWPAPPRAQNGQRSTPKPIDWNASLAQMPSASEQAQQPPQPQTPPQTVPRPAAQQQPAQPPRPPQGAVPPAPDARRPVGLDEAAQPLAFDLDEGEPLGDDLLESYSRQFTRADGYDDGDDDDEPTPRRRSSGGGSRPSRGGVGGSKTLFWWIGFLVIAVLIILYFVFFGDKDDAKNPGSGSGSSSGSLSASVSDSGSGSQIPDDSSSEPAADPTVEPIPRDEWYMVLANRDNPLPATFTVPQTATVGSAAVDSRIAEALRQMVNDAAAAGIQLLPNNGYRTVGQQQSAWDSRVQSFLNQGLSQQEAEARALDYTSMPGASDHNTGLGLDIVSQDHQTKDMAYADTAACAWLVEHAAEYGFIQRYPADKEEETGMDYEPWHFRYVGADQAAKIKASGLCLEEYLAQP